MDLHPAYRRYRRACGRHYPSSLLSSPLDKGRIAHSSRKRNFLGPFYPLRTSWSICRGSNRKGDRVHEEILGYPPVGRPRTLCHRSMAGRKPTPPLCRKCPLCTHHYRRYLRHPPYRFQELHTHSSPSTRMATDEFEENRRIQRLLRHRCKTIG